MFNRPTRLFPPLAVRSGRLLASALAGVGLGLYLSAQAQAQDQDPAGVEDPPGLSGQVETAPGDEASLSPERPQEIKATYRIGPGDSFQIRLYSWTGEEEAGGRDVQVGPDGNISFLHASKVRASGLTIPQLRMALEEKLAESYRDPRVVIQPVALISKGYIILGMVNGNGKFPLTRPIRLLEALALSGGARTSDGDASTTEQAGADITTDFRRSFLVRNNEKLAVDFEKLYLEGDMRHNIPVQDGDYIYLASNARHVIYALGSVGAQGAVPVRDGLTVMGVISRTGGFTRYAWKSKVLVIRGSLDQPETIVVDTGAILNGTGVDVPVQEGDIVYVHDRPWAIGERLLDTAIRSFINGAISGAIDEFYYGLDTPESPSN